MDLSKLGADLQAAVDNVVKAKGALDNVHARVASAEAEYAQALKTAQALRDAFTSALNQVVPGTPAPKSISG